MATRLVRTQASSRMKWGSDQLGITWAEYTSSEESEHETKTWFSMSKQVGTRPITQTYSRKGVRSTVTWDPYEKFTWKEDSSSGLSDESEEKSTSSEESEPHDTKSSYSFGKDTQSTALHQESLEFEATRNRLKERKASEMEEIVWRTERPNKENFEQKVRERPRSCAEKSQAPTIASQFQKRPRTTQQAPRGQQVIRRDKALVDTQDAITNSGTGHAEMLEPVLLPAKQTEKGEGTRGIGRPEDPILQQIQAAFEENNIETEEQMLPQEVSRADEGWPLNRLKTGGCQSNEEQGPTETRETLSRRPDTNETQAQRKTESISNSTKPCSPPKRGLYILRSPSSGENSVIDIVWFTCDPRMMQYQTSIRNTATECNGARVLLFYDPKTTERAKTTQTLRGSNVPTPTKCLLTQ
jgi:hypothetical protein